MRRQSSSTHGEQAGRPSPACCRPPRPAAWPAPLAGRARQSAAGAPQIPAGGCMRGLPQRRLWVAQICRWSAGTDCKGIPVIAEERARLVGGKCPGPQRSLGRAAALRSHAGLRVKAEEAAFAAPRTPRVFLPAAPARRQSQQPPGSCGAAGRDPAGRSGRATAQRRYWGRGGRRGVRSGPRSAPEAAPPARPSACAAGPRGQPHPAARQPPLQDHIVNAQQ